MHLNVMFILVTNNSRKKKSPGRDPDSFQFVMSHHFLNYINFICIESIALDSFYFLY